MDAARPLNHAVPLPVRIRMLGSFEVHAADGVSIQGLGRRTTALLACLAISEEAWSREDLAGLLWPGRRPEQRRGSLRQELLRLRRAFGLQAGIEADLDGRLRLAPRLAEVDVVAFRRAVQSPGGTSQAVALYRGPLLQGFQVEPQDPFADWLAQERATLQAAALELLLRLLRSSEGSEAIARRALAVDGACEEAHRYLIRHHADRGDPGEALAQFRACTDALRAQHGAGPSAATRALLDEVTIARGVRPPRPAAPPSASATLDWIRYAPDHAPLPTSPDAQPLAYVEDRPSVAVLPFADLSHDPLASGILADGMMEEVTNALARIPGFFVTARQSALAYRGVRLDARRIAAELGVRYLIEGSVEQDGRRMRANLRLVDGRTGMNLWAESQDGRLGDVMAVRDVVVHHLASRLQPRLMLEEINRAVRRPPRDLDAWTWLQRANAILLRGRHRDALEQVLEPLRRSLEADPHYAMANALLSAVHTWRAVSQAFPDPLAEKALARDLAEAALAADPDNPFVLTNCAETAIYSAADIGGALHMLELATARDPNDANGRAMLAHVRRSAGEDPRGSLSLIEDAMRLSPRDPRSFLWHHYASWCHFRLGDIAGMETASRRSIDLYGRYPLSWIGLTSALGLQERTEEARAAAAVLRRMRPAFTPDGFYETARNFYGRRFDGQVDHEYQQLRASLARAWEG